MHGTAQNRIKIILREVFYIDELSLIMSNKLSWSVIIVQANWALILIFIQHSYELYLIKSVSFLFSSWHMISMYTSWILLNRVQLDFFTFQMVLQWDWGNMIITQSLHQKVSIFQNFSLKFRYLYADWIIIYENGLTWFSKNSYSKFGWWAHYNCDNSPRTVKLIY